MEYFKGIGEIPFEGAKSKNPLAFKHYKADEKIAGKTMKEHLRFAVCHWHTFCGTGADPFGPGTRKYPWHVGKTAIEIAEKKQDALFELCSKLTVPYYCFHDRDLAPEGSSVQESEDILWKMAERSKKKQKETGVKLLWGTANLFSNPRYMNGASTNPDFDVLCHGAAQVKAALDVTKFLGGENYVFWGGREGYDFLFNTDMKRELAHFAQFLKLAKAHADKIGFKGQFLIEPKPMEPTKHQYDFDSATVLGFLKSHDIDFVKLNIEANHATLAGHTFAHDLQVAADAGKLGSIDANRGDAQNGWDTDQFPTNLYDTTEAMLVVLRSGGLGSGGLNFDAKVRRNSTDLEDIFLAHIGGMDAFARGLKTAHRIITESPLQEQLKNRYASYDRGEGKKFENGKLSLAELRDLAAKKGEPKQISGKQELIENFINDYI